jgi:hypothetical protein
MKFLKRGLVVGAAVAAFAIVSPGTASAGCRTTSTSGGTYPMTLATTVTWCWNGTNVTSASPAGGSTTHGPGGWWGSVYYQWDTYTRWSYGYLGTPNYDIYKTGRWHCLGDGDCSLYFGDHACVYTYLHLHGNGTYSVKPSGIDPC